ncbi:arginine--tRNA ligase [archaeon]|mgnify:CR=1 FL=1|jgi:arginyl-tRNA synthetase|nr:arginine--tRNA ligase [archaeon]MBT4397706.1 arginine--tRNA ligase [archaeon]MBT4441598.1 arginine--tRNA ligase [archaeon]
MDFKKEIIKLLKKEIKGFDDKLLEVPPNPEMGDYALPCFTLSKIYKKDPKSIAKDLKNKIKPLSSIEKILNIGPYLNFFIDLKLKNKYILEKILKEKNKYGSHKKKKKKVMIEYSQANTHKAFHVGHLRGTSLGEALARILKFNGYQVIQSNYQGDTGAHVSKWLWYYKKYSNGTPPKGKEGQWLAKIYVNSVKKLKDKPELKEEVEKINYNLEHNKSKELKALWRRSRKWSLDELNRIYKELDAHFDHFFFEREMEKRGKEIVNQLLKDKIAKISDGATIVDLDKLGVWVLLRRDGTILYSAKDLALAEKKFNKFKIDNSVYVVGKAQALHFQQLFKVLHLMKFKQADNSFHLSFDEVRLPSGKMSSRTGVNILYSDLRDELLDYATNETKQRHPNWPAKKIKETAKGIAMTSLKFSMIFQDNNKPIIFDQKQAMAFEGDTGPYILYSHARACSILKKTKASTKANLALLDQPEETNLINMLGVFPEIVEKGAKEYKPFHIAKYAIELSHAFNNFYNTNKCITEDKELTKARTLLVKSTKQVLANTLNLLGLKALKEM